MTPCKQFCTTWMHKCTCCRYTVNWNWDHLRFFLALAEQGTLSTAARSLDVSHTTVLRRVAAFESELGTQLFDRTSGGFVLTQAGERLFREAARTRTLLDSIAEEIAGADAELAGSVVITATDTISYFIMPRLIEALAEHCPGVDITLLTSNQLNNIHERDADIAIRACREPPVDVIGRRIGELPFLACASRAYMARHALDRFPPDPADHAFIVLNDHYAASPFHRWFEQRIAAGARRYVVSNFLVAAAMCRQGLGIAALPCTVPGSDPSVVPLATDEPIPSNELWILSPKRLRDTERVRVVRQYLYESLRDELIRLSV